MKHTKIDFVTIKQLEKVPVYILHKSNNIKLGILALFLTNDISCDSILSYKNFILSQDYEDTAGNRTFLEKENSKIIIGDLFADDPYEVVFETTQEQFLKILDQWEKLCKSKPKEIIIKKEGDKVTLEGKD